MHAFCNSARNFPDVRTLPTFPILSRRSHVAVSADFNQEDRKEIEYEKSLQYFLLEETGTHIHPRAPNHSSTLHSSIFLSHPLLQGENIHGMRSITTFYITFNVIATALPPASTSSLKLPLAAGRGRKRVFKLVRVFPFHLVLLGMEGVKTSSSTSSKTRRGISSSPSLI